jgi:oligopeptide/dipeptide ABC transporter ATP-binding protein
MLLQPDEVTAMTESLLEIRGLSVEFRRRRRTVNVAVDDVSLDVAAGETLGIVGESGSGKSTVTRAILGLTAIRSGEVRFAGQDITRLDFAGRRRLYRQAQLVFQDPYSSLNPARTVERTLAEPLQAYGEKDGRLLRARVREMLERVQLPDGTAGRYPGELSGGQRQRVAIARALMLSPRLVILDEPLSALDLSAQAQVLNLLRELQASAGLSYLFISHDLEVVRYLCDRVLVMYQGRVLESGPAGQVSGASAHPYTHMLHQASPVPDPQAQRRRHALADAAVAAPATAAAHATGPAEGTERCNFAPRCPFAVTRCWNERPRLRAAQAAAEVACHRFPAWRDEIDDVASGTPLPLAVPSQRAVPVTVAIEPRPPAAPPASRPPAEKALHGEDQ